MPDVKLCRDAHQYVIDDDRTPPAEQEGLPWGIDANRIDEDHPIPF